MNKEETIAIDIPKLYLKALLAIIQSGALATKCDKVILHFDKGNKLTIIELPPKKIYLENLTK